MCHPLRVQQRLIDFGWGRALHQIARGPAPSDRLGGRYLGHGRLQPFRYLRRAQNHERLE